MVLSSEFEERLRNTGGVLDLSGLALNSNASQLADVLTSKPVTHLVLADCMLDQQTADRLLESLSQGSAINPRIPGIPGFPGFGIHFRNLGLILSLIHI